MSKKMDFAILAGVGIGLVSGISPLTAYAQATGEKAPAVSQAQIEEKTQALQAANAQKEAALKAEKAAAAKVAEAKKALKTVQQAAHPEAAQSRKKLLSHVTPPLSYCQADAVALKFEKHEGEFTGMSHDGAVLTLINTGNEKCLVGGRPEITFLSKHKHVLDIMLKTPRGFNPGPVIVPVTLAPEAKVSTTLRWVSEEVFDHNFCYKPAFVAVTISGKQVRVPFEGRLCGDKNVGVTYTSRLFEPYGMSKAPAKASVKKSATKETAKNTEK